MSEVIGLPPLEGQIEPGGSLADFIAMGAVIVTPGRVTIRKPMRRRSTR